MEEERILGFRYELDEDGLVSIDVKCDYPQQNRSIVLFKKLEKIKIMESDIIFPVRIKHYVVTIKDTDKLTIMKYFKIDGIKKIVEEYKSNLIGKTTFIKPEILYVPKAKYPNLHIHFYQVSEEEGIQFQNVEEMIESCLIHYDNTKQFTNKRLSDLEAYVNTLEVRQMPFLPMEVVKFDDNGNIRDFDQHLLALKEVELPF